MSYRSLNEIVLLSLFGVSLLFAGTASAMTPPAGYEDEVRIKQTTWFSDLSADTRIGIAANALADDGVIGGFEDGTFRPHQSVNRAEMAKFITKIDGRCDDIGMYFIAIFSDLLEGEWYVPYVAGAADCNLIKGDPAGTFRPADGVNTAEFLAIVSRAPRFELETYLPHTFTDVPVDVWYGKFAGIADRYDLFPSRGSRLQPDRKLTRGEVAYALHRLMEKDAQPTPANPFDFADLSISIKAPKEIKKGRTITYDVTVHNNGPDTAEGIETFGLLSQYRTHPSAVETMSVGLSSGGSRFFKFRMPFPKKADCNDRIVYAFGVQAKTKDPVDSNNTKKARGVKVKCRSTETTQPHDSHDNGHVDAHDHPDHVELEEEGILYLTPQKVYTTEAKLGDDDAKIGRYRLRADGNGDQYIRSLRFTNKGTALDGDITDLRIQRTDGTVVSDYVESTRHGFATFHFYPPLEILAGDFTTVYIVGSIEDGHSRTIQMEVEGKVDIDLQHGRPILHGDEAHTLTIIDPMPPMQMKIEQLNLPEYAEADPGDRDITLFALEAHATEEEVYLTDLTFIVEESDDHDLFNYTLWTDTNFDGYVDTKLEEGLSPQNGILTFKDLRGGGAIIRDEPTRMEVHADVSYDPEYPTVRLSFFDTLMNYIGAEMLESGEELQNVMTDGECHEDYCQIGVLRRESTKWEMNTEE